MSGMTDRVSNQDLVQLAKKQYEQDKRKTIPSEIIQLVSRGQVYPKTHPLRGGTIEMRYMTAYDEDILTNPSYFREGVVLDKLLEALIMTPVEYSTITTLDKNGLLIAARMLSYGKEYPVIVKDPNTKNDLKRIVDLSKLKNSKFDLISDENGEFDYTLENGTKLKFKFLTLRENSDDTSISQFLENTIMQINDSRNIEDIRNFIRYEFLARDSKIFRSYIIDNTPSIIMNYEFEGENGGTFTAGFPIGPDFFWI